MTPGHRHIFAALLCTAIALPLASSVAMDWPIFRGPDGTGITTDSDWDAKALGKSPKIAWSKDIGKGYSSVSIVGDKVYTSGNNGKTDTIFCLNAADGEEIWKYSYACKAGSHGGPRATPAVVDGTVYAFSREGHVICLDAEKGTVTWQTHVGQTLQAKPPRWGFAGSPCVVGELVIVNAGDSGVALERKTGKHVWGGGKGPNGYATPVVFTAPGGKQAVAVFGREEMEAVDLESGKKLWDLPWKTSWDVNAADPIVIDKNKLFISSGYGHGCAMLELTANGVKKVWENESMRSQFSTPVLIDGHFYGIDGNAGKGKLRCIDAANGASKWEEDLGFGALIVAGGKLIVLNEKGMLHIAEASPKGYKKISSAKISSEKKAKFWTSPAIAGGRIYCRDYAAGLICVDVRKK